MKSDISVYDVAAAGDYEQAESLIKNGHKLSDFAVAVAASAGKYELAEWYIDHGGKILKGAVTTAIWNENFKLAEWYIDHGFVDNIDSDEVILAASAGKHESVQWYIDHGVKLSDDKLYSIISVGNCDLIKILVDANAIDKAYVAQADLCHGTVEAYDTIEFLVVNFQVVSNNTTIEG